MSPIVFDSPNISSIGSLLRDLLNGEEGKLDLRSFPDGETYLRILTEVEDRDVIVIASLYHPNEWFLNLLFLADALKTQKAKKITLVAPYLSYMRQDKIFNTGEALTSKTFAKLISSSFDALITVDPHLHRYHSLSEIYTIPATSLQVAPLISKWIQENIQDPFIIGPDAESAQWVSEIAGKTPNIVLSKVRYPDGHINITWPAFKGFQGRTPVLVDDIISSGDTMLQTIQHLKEMGAPTPVCIAIHPIFAGNSYEKFKEFGVKTIITSNSIRHHTNGIDLTPLIAEVFKEKK